jgi:hypothetical protein
MYIMNREELKKHITNFRLILPRGVKFSVIAQSAAVLESSKDLHCEYLYVAMDRVGYNWARMTYGEIETRIEGSWIGTSWLKVYLCYDEEHLVMVDDIPCQYVGSTNPFQDDPMLERPVPSIEDYMRKPSQQGNVIRAMAAALKDGMTESGGLIDISPEAVQKALDIGMDSPTVPVIVTGSTPMIARRKLEHAQPFASRGIIVSPPIKGDESDAELYALHFLGDTSVLDKFIADGLESRSASKALLQNPTALKDSLQGMSQLHRLRSTPFLTSEYRGRLVACSEDQMKLTTDPVHNRRQYNNASLRVKVAYKRRLAAWARALGKESLTAQCTVTKDNDGRWLSRRTHLATMEDHSVDSIAVARMYRPGMGRGEPVHTVFLDPELPREVNDTIEKFIGDEDKKEDKE